MSRAQKLAVIIGTVGAIIVVSAILGGPAILRSLFYSKPGRLPPVVGEATEQLLTRLQGVLETNAPIIARSLNPGLPDARIAQLETEGKFRLSPDLRVLYRWHNGMITNSGSELLPGQRFIPLEEALAERNLMLQQSGAAFELFAGYRKGWLHVLDDGAGDGYFYDPDRKDVDGAFFYHFAEDGHYVWFPSIRNFLSGVIGCYESYAVKIAPDGKTLEEDLDHTEKIWSRLAKISGP